MNALITASVSKNPVSPPAKAAKSLPRSMHTPWTEEGVSDDGSSRRHTVGAAPNVARETFVELDIGTYEAPTDVMVRLKLNHIELILTIKFEISFVLNYDSKFL